MSVQRPMTWDELAAENSRLKAALIAVEARDMELVKALDKLLRFTKFELGENRNKQPWAGLIEEAEKALAQPSPGAEKVRALVEATDNLLEHLWKYGTVVDGKVVDAAQKAMDAYKERGEMGADKG